jgi:GNAT superfamily N-acetyltransferase
LSDNITVTLFVSASKSRLRDCIPILEAFGDDCGLAERWGRLNEASFLTCWGGMMDAGHAFLVLMEEDREVVGAMGVVVGPMTFWDKLSANEIFWYVLPEHRKGSTPIRMLRVAEAEAKRRGCSVVVAGHKVFWNAEKMERLYRVVGYQPHDLMYVKEI